MPSIKGSFHNAPLFSKYMILLANISAWFYLVCDDCNDKEKEECEEHGPRKLVEDVWQRKKCEDRARKTLPKGLEIKPSRIHGDGVFARKRWRIRTRFGPYQGNRIRDEEEVEDLSYVHGK